MTASAPTQSAGATLSCEALGEAVVARLTGDEGMNRLPHWEVSALASDAGVDLEALLGEPATLQLTDADGATRTLPLLVTGAAYDGPVRDGHRYALELSAPAWLLTRRHGYRIFQELAVPEIVAALLADAGLPAPAWRLGGEYHKRWQCVQYDEDEWSFIERLLADEGINYWCDAADGEPLLVFGDGTASHAPIEGGAALPFRDPSGTAPTASALFTLERSAQLAHDSVHVADYDERQPDVLIEGRAGDGSREHYEYPAWVPSAEYAASRAQARLEQLRRHEEVARAQSRCVRLAPGRLLDIGDVPDENLGGEHLVVGLRHELREPSPNDPDQLPYANDARLVPIAEDRSYRPGLPRRVPRVEGLETAFVTGPPGEEIHVDDMGSIKIRTHWDRSGIDDDRSSRWVRTMQLNMAGSMMLPRVGWEVPIAYRDGRPDRPLCLGRLYDGGTGVPYPLPDKKATTSLMSGTSPGGGSTNELRFDDDKGNEELMVHASGDQTVKAGGNTSSSVGVDEVHEVGGVFGRQITGLQMITVAGNQTLGTVGGTSTLVTGARIVTVGGSETLGTDLNRTENVDGGYTESIGGFALTRCSKLTTDVGADYAEAVGGALAVVAPAGLNEEVLGVRSEAIAGSRSILSFSTTKETVTGLKKVVAASQSFTCAARHTTTAKGVVNLTAATTSMLAVGKLVIKAAAITIDVGSLSVRAGSTYELSGSHDASADVVVKAPSITYASSSEAKS